MADPARKTCFVVMGYGVKTDPNTGRSLNLDKTYRVLIKPAVLESGLDCVRADEIRHSGNIDVPMYDQLLQADLVVADISTLNANALYELGVRHALRPWTTIIMCEDQVQVFPFDLNHTVVLKYVHLGQGIDAEEADRFKGQLKQTIAEILGHQPPAPDSPVYTFLSDLQPPHLTPAQAAAAAAEAGAAAGGGGGSAPGPAPAQAPTPGPAASAPTTDAPGATAAPAETLAEVLRKADAAMADSRFDDAAGLYEQALGLDPQSHYVAQRLAAATAKIDGGDVAATLNKALQVLAGLHFETSTDPETLEIAGAIEKRLYELGGDPDHLDRALHFFLRAYAIRHDCRNGIELAFLHDLRATTQVDHDEQIADRVMARRVRRDVRLVANEALEKGCLDGDEKYWTLAALAEAHYGLDDLPEYRAARARSEHYLGDNDWMLKVSDDRIARLAVLLGREAPADPAAAPAAN